MEVKEVWFWEDGTIRIFALEANGYEEVENTRLIEDFPLQSFLKYINYHDQFDAVDEFLNETNAKNYDKEVKMKKIIGWSAWITIFISCIGLFGLSALSTEKRFKEIGVRKVLGASVNSIVGLLSLDFLKLILIAFVIAAPIEYYVAEQLLSNYPYRITQGVDMFLVTVGGLLIVGLFTVSYQAVKAALMNPVKSLKTE